MGAAATRFGLELWRRGAYPLRGDDGHEQMEGDDAVKLFYAPGACSLGIHVLLNEIGKPFELQKLSLMDGDQRKPAFFGGQPEGQGADARA